MYSWPVFFERILTETGSLSQKKRYTKRCFYVKTKMDTRILSQYTSRCSSLLSTAASISNYVLTYVTTEITGVNMNYAGLRPLSVVLCDVHDVSVFGCAPECR